MWIFSLPDYPGWTFTVTLDLAPSEWALLEAHEESQNVYFILATNAITGEETTVNNAVAPDEEMALLDYVSDLTH